MFVQTPGIDHHEEILRFFLSKLLRIFGWPLLK